MPSVRPTRYVVPIDEQDFQSLTPKVTVTNDSDFDAYVTGLVMIYRRSTGLMIYSSVLHPSRVNKGTLTDFEAETPWSPPAPVDNDYFIMCTTTATAVPPNYFLPITNTLAPFDFDIKPIAMGPAPAAHAPTHTNGGSDPLDHGTLPGLADNDHPQYQLRSEVGLAGGYCGLPDPLDTTLPLRADGTPARPTSLLWESDFLHEQSVNGTSPWYSAAISGGTTVEVPGEPQHPGVIASRSATAANGGRNWRVLPDALLLAGNEHHTAVIKLLSLTDIVTRSGFMDISGIGAITDGVWLEMSTIGGIPGTLQGKSAAAAAQSTTPTSTVLATGTWYVFKIHLNSNATLATFELFDDFGALIWTDTLNTHIPNIAGQETGICLSGWKTSANAVTFSALDYMSAEIRRPFIR